MYPYTGTDDVPSAESLAVNVLRGTVKRAMWMLVRDYGHSREDLEALIDRALDGD